MEPLIEKNLYSSILDMRKEAEGWRGVLLVLLAASLWGMLGTLYTWAREDFGLLPVAIVFWRAALAAICLGCLGGVMPLAGKGTRLLESAGRPASIYRVWPAGCDRFLPVLHLCSGANRRGRRGRPTYTSPVFVALIAWRFLGESFTRRKVVALLLTLAGCLLVARVFDQSLRMDLLGIACGLGSAVTYALYSILGKLSLRRGYPIATMSLYVFGIGSVGLLIIALAIDPAQLLPAGMGAGAWGLLALLAVVQTLGALRLIQRVSST